MFRLPLFSVKNASVEIGCNNVPKTNAQFEISVAKPTQKGNEAIFTPSDEHCNTKWAHAKAKYMKRGMRCRAQNSEDLF